jgi:DNA-binding MarR family transcriptional regulator
MARALERDGLIERRSDPTDARATLIFLTARAKELRPVAEEVVTELDTRVAELVPTRVRAPLKTALKLIADLDREGSA